MWRERFRSGRESSAGRRARRSMYVCVTERVMTHTYILHQALGAARRVFSAAELFVCVAIMGVAVLVAVIVPVYTRRYYRRWRRAVGWQHQRLTRFYFLRVVQPCEFWVACGCPAQFRFSVPWWQPFVHWYLVRVVGISYRSSPAFRRR